MLKISNVKVYGLEESIVASGYPMLSKSYTDEEFEKHVDDVSAGFVGDSHLVDLEWGEKRIKTAKHLGNVPSGTGHDNFLRGIIVQYDVRYPVYWTPQFQRYTGYNNIVSSQSAMHRLTKMNLDESFNEYVLPQVRDKIMELIEVYNEALSKGIKTVWKESVRNIEDNYLLREYISIEKNEHLSSNIFSEFYTTKHEEIPIEDLYMYIISSCPQGLEKTMRVSTNYLQLKTMWHQRRHHKLKDWKVFCDEIEKLPYFKELTGCGL